MQSSSASFTVNGERTVSSRQRLRDTGQSSGLGEQSRCYNNNRHLFCDFSTSVLLLCGVVVTLDNIAGRQRVIPVVRYSTAMS